MKRIGQFMVFASLLSSACQGPETFSQEEQPIVNGVEDTSAEHMAVVMVRSRSGNCTGTLIAPTVVLTAAHCTEDGSPNDYYVMFGTSLSDGQSVGVSEFIRHPNYQGLPDIQNDIALLRLKSPPPLQVELIPHLTQDLQLTAEDRGIELTFVGFGITGYGLHDYGVKRRVNLPLYDICVSLGGCQMVASSGTYDVPPNNVCYEQAAAGTCMGDSGGPALVVRNGQKYVAGVNSIVWGECNMLACGTKVDFYQKWIDEFIGTFAMNGQACSSSGQCYSGYCVKGVCCESACSDPCKTCPKGWCVPAADGTPCDDGLFCNGADSCSAGVCTPGGTPLECRPPSSCQVGSCEEGQGCVYKNLPDGTDCDNLDPCDGPDVCRSGLCQPKGLPLQCDDENPCTKDSCKPGLGCVNQPLPDDTSCADSDRCNGEEVCKGGVCQSSTALDCDDLNPCTEDSCDAVTGCQHQQLAEGTSCGSGRSCQKGLCLPKESGGCSSAGTAPGGWWIFFLALYPVFRRRVDKPRKAA